MKTDEQLFKEIEQLASTASARASVIGSTLHRDVVDILIRVNILLGRLRSQGYDVQHLIIHKSHLAGGGSC